MTRSRPSSHTCYLNISQDRARLVQFARARAALNGQSLSAYIWDLIEADLRELPAALDELKRDVTKELRIKDGAERERLGIG